MIVSELFVIGPQMDKYRISGETLRKFTATWYCWKILIVFYKTEVWNKLEIEK